MRFLVTACHEEEINDSIPTVLAIIVNAFDKTEAIEKAEKYWDDNGFNLEGLEDRKLPMAEQQGFNNYFDTDATLLDEMKEI